MSQLIFLGTAGARFVVFKQIRASGGIWLKTDNTNILIDPGPCSLLRVLKSKHKLSFEKLDAVILSHRHLDHSADVNVVIEAMTDGGFKKRGELFAPADAILGEDPVVLKYLREYLHKITIIKEKKVYKIKDIEFHAPCRHRHRGETYGFIFNISGKRLGFIVDTEFFEELKEFYKESDILVINVVRFEKKEGLDHLCVKEAEEIIKAVKPEKAILTHFGMTMIKAKPWMVAEKISKNTGVNVIAANDGMLIEF